MFERMYEELLKSVNYTNEYDIVASGAYYETETGNIFEDTTTCQLGNNIIGKNIIDVFIVDIYCILIFLSVIL